MDILTVKAKLSKAGFVVLTERSAPNGTSVQLTLRSGDKVIVENTGVCTAIGENKEKIDEILSTPDLLETFKKVKDDFLTHLKAISKYIGSAAVGGVIGNKADKQLDGLFSKEQKKNTQDGSDSHDSPFQKDSVHTGEKTPDGETIILQRDSISNQTGIVEFYNEAKGYGFIKSDLGGEAVFVHISGLVDQICENDKVRFNVERGKKGLNAVNVRLCEPSTSF